MVPETRPTTRTAPVYALSWYVCSCFFSPFVYTDLPEGMWHVRITRIMLSMWGCPCVLVYTVRDHAGVCLVIIILNVVTGSTNLSSTNWLVLSCELEVSRHSARSISIDVYKILLYVFSFLLIFFLRTSKGYSHLKPLCDILYRVCAIYTNSFHSRMFGLISNLFTLC